MHPKKKKIETENKSFAPKKKNWDVEIPQPKQGGSVSIYRPCGKE